MLVKKLVAVAAGFLAVLAMLVLMEFSALYDANVIKSTLEETEGVDVVDVWGNEDVTLEDIYAVITVRGKGPVTILALTPESIKEAKHFRIAHIGEWELDVLRLDEFGAVEASWSDIDIGREGNFARFLNFKLNSVEDLVQRYDEVLSLIESLPELPERISFSTEEGKQLRLGVIRASKSRWQRESRGLLPSLFAIWTRISQNGCSSSVRGKRRRCQAPDNCDNPGPCLGEDAFS